MDAADFEPILTTVCMCVWWNCKKCEYMCDHAQKNQVQREPLFFFPFTLLSAFSYQALQVL